MTSQIKKKSFIFLKILIIVLLAGAIFFLSNFFPFLGRNELGWDAIALVFVLIFLLIGGIPLTVLSTILTVVGLVKSNKIYKNIGEGKRHVIFFTVLLVVCVILIAFIIYLLISYLVVN